MVQTVSTWNKHAFSYKRLWWTVIVYSELESEFQQHLCVTFLSELLWNHWRHSIHATQPCQGASQLCWYLCLVAVHYHTKTSTQTSILAKAAVIPTLIHVLYLNFMQIKMAFRRWCLGDKKVQFFSRPLWSPWPRVSKVCTYPSPHHCVTFCIDRFRSYSWKTDSGQSPGTLITGIQKLPWSQKAFWTSTGNGKFVFFSVHLQTQKMVFYWQKKTLNSSFSHPSRKLCGNQ